MSYLVTAAALWCAGWWLTYSLWKAKDLRDIPGWAAAFQFFFMWPLVLIPLALYRKGR